MQTLSLYAKLRNLFDAGVLSLKADHDLCAVLEGEGTYYYGNEKVEVLSGVTAGESDNTPLDIAWVPNSGVILAQAPTDTGPFEMMPPALRKIVASFKDSLKNSVH
jgi:hypothetical protein